MGALRVRLLTSAVGIQLLALAACASGAVALAAGADGGPEPLQRELLLFEEPSVSSAVKHPQTVREAPAAVTVITREEIRRFGYRTLAEALRSVAGFYTSDDRNYSFVGVRGFLRPGDYNDRILLLVNGHTYNDDAYQTASFGEEFGIDLEAVDRIEVIRGPGSALYGGNALFAVVNVVTLSPQESPGVRPLVETGSFGRKRGQLSVGHVAENGLEVFASGSVLDVDGQHRLFYPEFDDPSTNNGVAEDADGERALKFFLSARYGKFFLQGGVSQRNKHIPTGSFGTTFNDNATETTDARRFADLTYATTLRPDVTLTARAFYDSAPYHGTYVYGSGADRILNEDLTWSDWFGGEVRARWVASEHNAVTIGGEYTYHPGVTQENFNRPGHETVLHDRRVFGAWGVYAQDELAVLPNLTLVGGLRYDKYYDRLDQLSPRVAAIWQPLAPTTVKLLFGQAFRPPNQFEQYYAFPSDGGTGQLANPRLDPEHITTYEAVLEQDLWGRARASLALYHYDVSDLIDQIEIPAEDGGDSAIQYRNAGSVRANGAELELRVPLPGGAALRTSYSIQEARASGGRLLNNSPKHLADVAVLFPLRWGFEGGTELQVVGPRHTLQGRMVETVRLLNLTLNYRSPIPSLSCSAGLYNLLDQTYSDPGGAELVQDRIRQNGFTFRIQLQYGF